MRLEPPSLPSFVGHMKVQAFAELAGLGVEELVAVVLRGRQGRASAAAGRSPAAARRLPSRPEPKATLGTRSTLRSTASNEPPLAAMLGRVSYRQIRSVVDRWLLGQLFDEHDGNVSEVGRRLHISRRNVRERWARVRAARFDERSTRSGRSIPAPPPPSLTKVFEREGTYAAVRKALERWMIGAVLAHAEGNVSQAARSLGLARTQFRKRWARVRPGG
jgi:hypothetical protein